MLLEVNSIHLTPSVFLIDSKKTEEETQRVKSGDCSGLEEERNVKTVRQGNRLSGDDGKDVKLYEM